MKPKNEEDIVYISSEDYDELRFYEQFQLKMNAVNMVMELDPLKLVWVCKNEAVSRIFQITPEEAIELGDRIVSRIVGGVDFEETVIEQVEAFKKNPSTKWAGVFRPHPIRDNLKWIIYSSAAMEVNEKNETTKIAATVILVDDIFNTPRTLHSFKDYIVRETSRVEVESLTTKQRKILALVGEGVKRVDIANELGISKYTVADHIQAIYKKFKISNTADLILLSRRLGLVYENDK